VSTDAPIQIVVNGEERTLAASVTVRQLLLDLALDPARVAVELDRHIVKPKDWDTTSISSGARLEIVQFVGGG